jgi:hypothetical protein
MSQLAKRNVKLILKILSDLEPLRCSSNKKNVVFNSFVCKLGFFGSRGPLKLEWNATHAKKKPKLHTNSLNKLCTIFFQMDTDYEINL